MRKQRKLETKDYNEIVALAVRQVPPAEIWRSIDKRVSLPTIRDIWKEKNPPDDSGTWNFLEAENDEAQLILPVLDRIFWMSRGRIRSFTRREAHILVKLRKASAEMAQDPALSWAMMREYVRRGAMKEDTEDLDLTLAVGPSKLIRIPSAKLRQLAPEVFDATHNATVAVIAYGLAELHGQTIREFLDETENQDVEAE